MCRHVVNMCIEGTCIPALFNNLNMIIDVFLQYYFIQTTVPRTTPVVTTVIPDITTVLTKPKATPDPSVVDEGKKGSHDVGKNTKLPIWLIAVVAGGAVIATLGVTIIIWLCWRMKRR